MMHRTVQDMKDVDLTWGMSRAVHRNRTYSFTAVLLRPIEP